MGEKFHPWSICTDGSTVFVTDVLSAKLHLISVEDGSVNITISLHPSGLDYPTSVRLRGEYLYVGHLKQKMDTYFISKFTNQSQFRAKPLDIVQTLTCIPSTRCTFVI